jgi:hypothetical protein
MGLIFFSTWCIVLARKLALKRKNLQNRTILEVSSQPIFSDLSVFVNFWSGQAQKRSLHTKPLRVRLRYAKQSTLKEVADSPLNRQPLLEAEGAARGKCVSNFTRVERLVYFIQQKCAGDLLFWERTGPMHPCSIPHGGHPMSRALFIFLHFIISREQLQEKDVWALHPSQRTLHQECPYLSP